MIVIVSILALCGIVASGWSYFENEKAAADERARLLQIVRDYRSDDPAMGLPFDWLNCLKRFQSGPVAPREKFPCETWVAQGVTSTLFALRIGDDSVPVVESRLSGATVDKRLVVDIVGGPGGTPFHSNPAMTDEVVKVHRQRGMLKMLGGAMEDSPAYQVLQRGYTIASVGYWGTNIRTVQEPNEIKLAMRDVRLAIDYYRDELGRDPPLITFSLGNHLALGAIGKERLEGMNFLSLVPVMDGLQHHLARAKLENAKAKASGDFFGEWKRFSIYKRSGSQVTFDHSRNLELSNFGSRFFGQVDLPWHDVTPTCRCSKIVLGTKDPRTADYLAVNNKLPSFVKVWESDHDLNQGAPDQTRELFGDYADCLIAAEG
ncbi:hypothetical protein [Allopontixanthobacter sediminis]|uniref:Alpha/beta hydrolase n=1 Tax=Allopontixanthobacter sediminis TaxID=1689985 RepID=A0A845B7C1_9SPHN|nr:hypothetical protein [Allopontixanthobacter sediminis]MXP45327.1 hypothetical protein [Allopontixanthobacter sediminis]